MKKLPPSFPDGGRQRQGLPVLHFNSQARGEMLAYFASHLIEEPALPDAETHPDRICELIVPGVFVPNPAHFGSDMPIETYFTRRVFQKQVIVLGNMTFTGWEEIKP